MSHRVQKNSFYQTEKLINICLTNIWRVDRILFELYCNCRFITCNEKQNILNETIFLFSFSIFGKVIFWIPCITHDEKSHNV